MSDIPRHLDFDLQIIGASKIITGSDNTLDKTFNQDLYLKGVSSYIKNAEWGDFVELQIVDPSTQAILKQFAYTVYLKDSSNWEQYKYESLDQDYLPQGLIVRMVYNQTNPVTSKNTIIHYIFYNAD